MTEINVFHKHRGAQTGLSASHKEQHGLCRCMFLSSVLCIQVVLLQFENFHKGSCVFTARRGSSSGRCKCGPLSGHILEGYVHSVKCVCVCVCVCVCQWLICYIYIYIYIYIYRLQFYLNIAKTKHNCITCTYSHNVLLIVYNKNIKTTVNLQIYQNRHC